MKPVTGFYLPPILDCLQEKEAKTEGKLGSWVAVSGEKNMGVGGAAVSLLCSSCCKSKFR